MATITIAEYSGLANTGFDGQVAAPGEDTHLLDQQVAVPTNAGPAAASAAFQSAPSRGPAPMAQPPQGQGTKWLELTTDTACHYAIGPAGTVATAANRVLPANAPPLLRRVPENQAWIISVLGV